ncbi:hypothetical protein ACA910_014783 [Epithemia clementina (nom. ined.)]
MVSNPNRTDKVAMRLPIKLLRDIGQHVFDQKQDIEQTRHDKGLGPIHAITTNGIRHHGVLEERTLIIMGIVAKGMEQDDVIAEARDIQGIRHGQGTKTDMERHQRILAVVKLRVIWHGPGRN